MASNSYHTNVVGSFVNTEGKRKTTIQVLNDKNQVLGQFDLENRQEDEKFENDSTFDGKSIQNMKKNEVENRKSKNGKKTTIKKLRPTQIGRRTYDCYFEEVIGNDGTKKLTLIMKDEDQ